MVEAVLGIQVLADSEGYVKALALRSVGLLFIQVKLEGGLADVGVLAIEEHHESEDREGDEHDHDQDGDDRARQSLEGVVALVSQVYLLAIDVQVLDLGL